MTSELLYYVGGAYASLTFYVLAAYKGIKDISRGEDTFFARAQIPVLNKLKIRKEPITNEIEFQEFLRTRREILEKERQSMLENEVRGEEGK